MAMTTALLNLDGPEVDGVFARERYSLTITNTPTIAAGAAAGASPTVAIAGTDVAGTISITTGTTALGSNGILATITFGNTMAAAPDVVLTPSNDAAFELLQTATTGAAARVRDADTTTTVFVVRSGDAAPADSTLYTFNYVVRNARVTVALAARWIKTVKSIMASCPLVSISKSGATATMTIEPSATSGEIALIGTL